ncbi:aromatic ring-hydroxylating dioxygenase subunit alpha [Paenibacillus pasadenensis]|uniref:Vanillate demethylase n=1 Tax=Paenibacillus pasadenensis TaxID=217090 RepID=A0A2N5NCX5_9BACL|nr:MULTISPECIES: aromatic ring-hydroxylating dioxygenase subunit alpha [Paenibacillus]PLT48197.1 Vanillate demethylase [Paenibacillus pasadenensis]QGG58294.1 Rieske 2Fe-2S domain-containing protein [Paenibacillus sp. B01]
MRLEDPVLTACWHPAALARDVTDRPYPVTVLGEKLVLFRSGSGVHALKDLCIHRGVPLSLGKVDRGELVCAYHGWRYDGGGACVCIPSLPPRQPIPSKARAEAYRCREEGGFVWVCLGEAEPERLPLQGKVDPALIPVWMGPYPVQAAAPRVVENFLDVSHLMFVHEGLLGDSRHAEINDYGVHRREDALFTDEIVVYQPDPDGRGVGVESRYVYEIFGPTCVKLVKRSSGSDEEFHLFLIVLPETATACTAFMLQLRNYSPNVPEQVFIDFQNTLLAQDKVIVEAQKPELLPLDLQAELHLRSDRVAIAYRRMLREQGMTIGTE